MRHKIRRTNETHRPIKHENNQPHLMKDETWLSSNDLRNSKTMAEADWPTKCSHPDWSERATIGRNTEHRGSMHCFVMITDIQPSSLWPRPITIWNSLQPLPKQHYHMVGKRLLSFVILKLDENPDVFTSCYNIHNAMKVFSCWAGYFLQSTWNTGTDENIWWYRSPLLAFVQTSQYTSACAVSVNNRYAL